MSSSPFSIVLRMCQNTNIASARRMNVPTTKQRRATGELASSVNLLLPGALATLRRDDRRRQLALARKRVQRRHDDVPAIVLEKPAQRRSRVAAAVTVGAEHAVAASVRHERTDLVGVLAHVVGGGDDIARGDDSEHRGRHVERLVEAVNHLKVRGPA